MSRIPTHASIDASPAAAKPLLEAVNQQLGFVPNLFRVVANSPAALEGYLAMSGALAKGKLPAQTRERIALAVAQINGCCYCLSAHSEMRKHFAKLSEAKVARERGHIADADVQAMRMAGYDEAQIVEIVQHVALNTWTNYLNEVAKTEIDFPVAQALAA